ncbi:MAG: hypothetical protein QOK88_03555 [Nitrososphaeraceae archaeon]|jgi:hypothetical protein|nr:hypothetical protein [Nitrososphaeraceae archaeon]MDW0156123.1 hypothetical protein [Nitrososphaeraceae archaeon]MDW3612408.1 hypothetical protein [Nitrososphaeraceae archaeon]
MFLLGLSLIVSALLSSATIIGLVNAVKLFCYDKVGEDHPCFETEKKCKQVLKHDDIAESPCYIE